VRLGSELAPNLVSQAAVFTQHHRNASNPGNTRMMPQGAEDGGKRVKEADDGLLAENA
jgi:hypothetical protein